jgi:hypothetical protein
LVVAPRVNVLGYPVASLKYSVAPVFSVGPPVPSKPRTSCANNAHEGDPLATDAVIVIEPEFDATAVRIAVRIGLELGVVVRAVYELLWVSLIVTAPGSDGLSIEVLHAYITTISAPAWTLVNVT